jgi:hypothetical protein
MIKFESMDFEDINDENFNRKSEPKSKLRSRIKSPLHPDELSPEEVIGSLSHQLSSKNPEDTLIAEEEARELESLFRGKYDIPGWMGLEEITRRLQTGENMKETEEAVKEAVEVEKKAKEEGKNKFHKELALNGGEIVDVESKEDKETPSVINSEEVEEVLSKSKEKTLSKERSAISSKKIANSHYFHISSNESHGKRGKEPRGKFKKGLESIKRLLKIK